MAEMKDFALAFKKGLGGDLRVKIIVILGLAGMALILLSQFFADNKPGKSDGAAPAQFTSAAYAAELEEKLCGLISGMDGVGRARVMITLEDAGETVYAQEEKRNVDKQQENSNELAVGKTYQKENVEQKYIIVDGEKGREALVKTRLEPRIQGVVVLCEGAGRASVEQSVIQVVTTALNIPTTRVCVVKISK